MSDLTLPLLIGALTAAPFILLYWVMRYVARRKVGLALRAARPWQLPTLQGWVERRWLEPELVEALPGELSPAVVFYEWAWADPEVPRHWRFRQPVNAQTPVEAMVRDAWGNLPEPERARTRERLAEAVSAAGTWWGGAER